MSETNKRLAIGTLVFVIAAAIAWSGGIDIERGPGLAWALIGSLSAATIAAAFPYEW